MMFYLKVLSVVFVLLAVCFLVVNFFSGKNMENQNLIITSLVFNNNESIPAKYTCDGENVNPPLKISGNFRQGKKFGFDCGRSRCSKVFERRWYVESLD